MRHLPLSVQMRVMDAVFMVRDALAVGAIVVAVAVSAPLGAGAWAVTRLGKKLEEQCRP